MGMLMVDLSAFNYRQVQDCLSIIELFAGAGITDLATIRRELEKQAPLPATPGSVHGQATKKHATGRPVCSVCGGAVIIEQVNTCRSTRVAGPWRSSISCRNPDCLHVDLTTKTLRELKNGA